MTDIQTQIDQLPRDKKQRIAAIEQLAYQNQHAELLLALVKKERGNCKTAAQKTLATITHPQASAYWKNLLDQHDLILDEPQKCELLLKYVDAASVSDLLATQLQTTLNAYLDKPTKEPTKQDTEYLSALIRMSIGQTSQAMCNTYRYMAKHSETFDKLFDKKSFDIYENTTSPITIKKLAPFMLTASLILKPHENLLSLAAELYKTHGARYIGPAFAASLLTQNANDVYTAFSPHLQNAQSAPYLLDVFGLIHYYSQKKDNPYEKKTQTPQPENHHYFNIDLTRYVYGIDDGLFLDRPFADQKLDARWISDLIALDDTIKPPTGPAYITHCAQYTGTVTGDYDHILGDLFP